MGINTLIQWTDHTFNPWIGCTKVSPGCANCYAETLMDTRYGRVKWGKGQKRIRTSEANWKLPLAWDKRVALNKEHYREAGLPYRRPRVFCASLADWLDDEVSIEWFIDLLRLIDATPNLDWQLLTKRPENFWKRVEAVRNSYTADVESVEWRMCNAWWFKHPIANIQIGTTVENQEMADLRHPILMQIPARVHFWSTEPMLSEIHAVPLFVQYGSPEWVICGGESGPQARPMHPEWVRSLRDQCDCGRIPFFFKQWGEWYPGWSEDSNDFALDPAHGVDDFDGRFQGYAFSDGQEMGRIGKKAAGRLLDGREWSEFPEAQK